MDRGEMEHMLVGRVRQKASPLFSCLQDRRFERDVAQLSDDTADFQAPVGIEVIQHPVKALDLRELPGHVIQVCRKVHTGPSRSQVANEFTSRYHNCPAISRIASSGYADHGLTLAFFAHSMPEKWGFSRISSR